MLKTIFSTGKVFFNPLLNIMVLPHVPCKLSSAYFGNLYLSTMVGVVQQCSETMF